MTTDTEVRRMTPQHMIALQRAHQVRSARARLRGELARASFAVARLQVARLLEDPPDTIATMEIGDLLAACRRMGPRYTTRLLLAIDVRSNKPVGELTERQRKVLATALRQAVATYNPRPRRLT